MAARISLALNRGSQAQSNRNLKKAIKSTVIAGIAAWVQTKDFSAIANSYAIASRQLSTTNTLIRHQNTEEEWASFVAEAEGSLLREQTQWQASRT